MEMFEIISIKSSDKSLERTDESIFFTARTYNIIINKKRSIINTFWSSVENFMAFNGILALSVAFTWP